MQANPTVLITRPHALALRTAKRVKALGFEPVILPFSKTVILGATLPDRHFDGAIVTSTAAIHALTANDIARFCHVPLFCVGPRTADIAAQAGFTRIAAICPDARRLTIALEHAQGQDFLYFAGRVRRDTLELKLKAMGKNLDIVEVYDTQFLFPDDEELAALPHSIGYILLYSQKAVGGLAALADHINVDTKILCLSQRIADAAAKLCSNEILFALEPDEDTLLSLFLRISCPKTA